MITLLRNSFQRPLLSHSPVLLPRAISNQSIYSCPLTHFSNQTSGHNYGKEIQIQGMQDEESDDEPCIRDVSGKRYKIPKRFNLYPMKSGLTMTQYMGVEVDILNRYKDERAVESLYYLGDELNYFCGMNRYYVTKVDDLTFAIYCNECERFRKQNGIWLPGFRIQCFRNEDLTPKLFVYNRSHFKGHSTDHDPKFQNDGRNKDKIEKLLQWKYNKLIEESAKQKKVKKSHNLEFNDDQFAMQ
eukprot:403357274